MFKDFDKAPPLQFGEWLGFHDADPVADLRLIIFIVDMELGNLFDDFAELRVRDTGHGLHNDGFLHGTGDNFSNARFAEAAPFGGLDRRCWRGWGFDGGLAHGILSGRDRLAFDGEHGFDAGRVATEGAEHVRLFELAGLLLHTEVEDFVAQIFFAGLQFFDSKFFDFGDFHTDIPQGRNPGIKKARERASSISRLRAGQRI